jgi:WD40 repeat protein
MAPTQLFLSCVSAEFSSYRDELRHNLDLVDVSVKIQEDFIAGGVPTLEKLDTYIKACDAVIHLVGDGLGSIAKPRSLEYLRRTYPDLTVRFPVLEQFLDDNSKGLSYTQWEAWLALIHHKNLLICVPGVEAPRKQGYRRIEAEQSLQQAHLERLRGLEAYPEVKFLNIHHLTSEILRALYKDLRPFASQINQPCNEWNWPKPWDFTLFSNEKREGFVGREWLFAEVRNWATNPDSEQALVIAADYGVGKTAFLAELLERYSESHSQPSEENRIFIAAHHFCTLEQADTLIPGLFVKSLAAQFAKNIPAYRQALETQDAKELRRFLDEANTDPMRAFEQSVLIPLANLHQPQDIALVLVDGLDESKDPRADTDINISLSIVQLLSRFAKRLPPWLRLLATSRRRPDVLKTLGQSFSLREFDAEEPRNLSDLYAYAIQRCEMSPLRGRLESAGLTLGEVANFLSSEIQSSGKFLYVALVLNEIASGILPLTCWDDLNSLPCGLENFYKDSFQRRFPTKKSYAPVAPILAVIAEAREPMCRSDLELILSDDQRLASNNNISEILKPMHDLLRLRLVSKDQHENTGSEVYFSYDHLSLKQWLTTDDEWGYSRAERFAIDCHEAFHKIRRWSLSEVETGRAHTCQYLVRQLPYHVTEEERSNVISKVLSQFQWLLARLRLAGLTSLMSDFSLVSSNPAMVRLKRALFQAAHVLRHDQTPAISSMQRALRQAKRETSGDYFWAGQEQQLASQMLARLWDNGELESLRFQATQWLYEAGGAPPLVPSLTGQDTLQLTLDVESTVNALVELPNGHIASGSNDGIVRIWDPDSGYIENVFRGHQSSVTALVILPDGRLATGSFDGTVRIWDLTSGDCTQLDGHEGGVRSLEVVNGGLLASGCQYGNIHLWDVTTNQKEKILYGHNKSVVSLVFWNDNFLLSGSEDGRVLLWTLEKNDYYCIFDGKGIAVNNLLVLDDGRLACSLIDNTILVWRPDSGPPEQSYRLMYGLEVLFSVAPLREGLIVVGRSGGEIDLLDLTTNTISGVLRGHVNGVWALKVLSDGRIASGSGDGTIRIWDPSRHADGEDSRKHGGKVNALLILSDGRLASGSADGSIFLWDTSNCAPSSVHREGDDWIWSLVQLADGRIASGSSAIILSDLASSSYVEQLDGHQDDILSLTVLTSESLASGSRDGTIRIWDKVNKSRSINSKKISVWDKILVSVLERTGAIKPASYQCRMVLKGHTDGIWTIGLLDDDRIVTGSEDKTIRLWEMPSGSSIVLEGHREGVMSIKVLNTTCFISGSKDGTIRLWDLAKGTSKLLEGHVGGVRSLEVLPDGRFVSGSRDRTILIWDPSRPDGCPELLFVADAPIRSLAWVPYLQILVAGDDSGRLHWLKPRSF